MSIFASQTQQTVPIPWDSPHTLLVRKLTGNECEQAQAEHLRDVLGQRARGWAARFQRLLDRIQHSTVSPAEIAHEAQRVIVDPLAGYDRLTVATKGIVGWTYQEGDQPKPVSPAAVADLDDETLEVAAVAIMRLTKPALFQTDEEWEIGRKNG